MPAQSRQLWFGEPSLGNCLKLSTLWGNRVLQLCRLAVLMSMPAWWNGSLRAMQANEQQRTNLSESVQRPWSLHARLLYVQPWLVRTSDFLLNITQPFLQYFDPITITLTQEIVFFINMLFLSVPSINKNRICVPCKQNMFLATLNLYFVISRVT